MKITKVKNVRGDNAKGFSLIELLVAIGVFMVIVTISLGSVVSIIDAGRKAKALKSMMTNLNFTLEVMSREIKFGSNYYCGLTTDPDWSPQTCDGGSLALQNAITFRNSDDVDTIFRLNTSTGQIEKSTDHGTSFLGMTAPDVTIQDLKFSVLGSGENDEVQPRVLILVRGFAGGKLSLQSRFTIQTLVSQRALDLQ